MPARDRTVTAVVAALAGASAACAATAVLLARKGNR